MTPERSLMEDFLDKVGTNWSFDPLRDPKWTPSREDYAALRDGAREALAVLEGRLAESDQQLELVIRENAIGYDKLKQRLETQSRLAAQAVQAAEGRAAISPSV